MEHLLSGETVMSDKVLELERCCRQLVALGRRQGGYITYDTVAEAFRASQCEVSMEALDRVYERLTAEGIELVDQLPCGDVEGGFSEGWQFVQEGLQRPQVARRGPRKYCCYWFEGDLDLDRQEPVRCPEDVIDTLLLQEEGGSLSAQDILTVIEECGLSELETEQLVEYLGSKGVDFVGVELPRAFRSVSEEGDTIQDQDRPDILADPGVQALLRDIRRLKKLTASEESRLARLAQEGDREASSRLIEGNLWHVFRAATYYVGMGLDFLDLFQEGCIGLIKALSKFDWRSGNRFCSYASWWILQGIGRAIANCGRAVRLPVHTIETLRRLRNATDYLYQVLGREPTTDEIACEMGLPERKVRELQMLSQPILSWEGTLVEWEEAGTYPGWLMEEYGALPDDGELNRLLLRETVAAVLKELKPREREVLRLRFGLDGYEPQTLDEIGRYFGVTRERVRQIETKALKRLRHPKRCNKLRDFLG